MEAVECRYRGRVIGWLIEGPEGFLSYERATLYKLMERMPVYTWWKFDD